MAQNRKVNEKKREGPIRQHEDREGKFSENSGIRTGRRLGNIGNQLKQGKRRSKPTGGRKEIRKAVKLKIIVQKQKTENNNKSRRKKAKENLCLPILEQQQKEVAPLKN